MSAIDALQRELRGRPSSPNPEYWAAAARSAADEVAVARDAEDPDTANAFWFLGSVASARALMCQVFLRLKEGDYKEAWMQLEQVELTVAALKRNSFLPDEFEIELLGRMVERWQSLYPYTVFASPEIIVKRETCSICEQDVDPFAPCGHERGKVYAGRLCSRLIHEAEVVSVSLVRDPVQKYSVLIPDPDPNDYTRVRYVAERVSGPFSRWNIEQTVAYHDHELFAGWPVEGDCPCRSGRTYRSCCRTKPGVLMPHFMIGFDEPFAGELAECIVRVRESRGGGMREAIGTYPNRKTQGH